MSGDNSVCVLILTGARRNSLSYGDLYTDPDGVPRIGAMDH